jgi:tetratricopeptide (TPR) repeat protein
VSTLGLATPDERRAATQEAVDMARRLGDTDVLLWTLNARHLVLWGSAPPEELLATAQELCELSRRSGRHELLLDALLWSCCDLLEIGDMLAMQRLRDEYMALVERYGSPWHRYMAIGGDILAAAAFGELNRARELSSAMRAMGRRVQDGLADTFHELRIMFYDLLQGREQSRADNPFASIEPPAGVAADYRVFWALSWANRGYVATARGVLLQTLARREELLDSLRRPVLAMLAEVAVVLEERAAMEEIYQLLAPASGRHLVLQACVYMGPVDYYLGVLAAALGRCEQACRHYQSAIDATISPVVIAQTQYALGHALAAQHEAHEHARTLLTSARDHGQRFGFSPLNERADAALAAL